MGFLDEWETGQRSQWAARYGSGAYPKLQDDGTYSPGIGHTGDRWPRGRGHDYCWAPFDCISCGCGRSGPCWDHENEARIRGFTGPQRKPADYMGYVPKADR